MANENSCPNALLSSPFQQYSVCMTLLCAIFNKNPNLGEMSRKVNLTTTALENYDFIVVGSGSAGATVAGRLSENLDWNVALFEAGPEEPLIMEIPSFFNSLAGTIYDWDYRTTNESHACLEHNGECRMIRGKNLGGCTAHYGMAYHRGNPRNYKHWLDLGNKGWSYEDVLKYFLKSENNSEIERVGSKYHATGGPMQVERFRWQPPLAWKLIEAAAELGYGRAEDLVGNNVTGFGVVQTMSKNGVRQTIAAAFLGPHSNQSNLHVFVNSTVTRLITKNKRVIGIEYVRSNETEVRKAYVNHEVIVSGGTINSPQLLLLSGIGPKSQLQSLGVRVVQNLPGVGENFHNHVSYNLQFDSNVPARNDLTISAAREYAADSSGIMSSSGLAQLVGNVASNYTTQDNPDIQIYFGGHQAICPNAIELERRQMATGRRTFAIQPLLVQPRSRGRITLRSANYSEHPIIWSNDLGEEIDRKILVNGIRVGFKLAYSSVLKPYNIRLIDEPVSACSKFEYMSDDYWNCSIQHNTRTENHQAGTCKMGPKSDKFAVVNNKLQVHGIKGLRVADASIMPQVVAGNPAAVITMIGERAADFIKQQYGKSKK